MARVATFLGNGETVTVVTAVVARHVRLEGSLAAGLWLALTVAGGALVGTAVKVSVERVRPDSAGVLTSAQGFAFPSGHARGATITYVAVFLVVAWQVLRPARRRQSRQCGGSDGCRGCRGPLEGLPGCALAERRTRRLAAGQRLGHGLDCRAPQDDIIRSPNRRSLTGLGPSTPRDPPSEVELIRPSRAPVAAPTRTSPG